MKERKGSRFSFTTHVMGQLMKCGSALLGVFCLLAGPAWAQEDAQTITTMSTGRAFSVTEWNIDDAFAENVALSFRETRTAADNVFGSSTCSTAATTQFLGFAEPPAADTEGVCDPASAAIQEFGSFDYTQTDCRLDDTGQTFTIDVPGTAVVCIPFSCWGEQMTTDAGSPFSPFKVGCTQSTFYTLTTMSEDGTSTVEIVQTTTVEEGDYDTASGQAMLRSSTTSTGMVTFTPNPGVELPANDVAIEVPGAGSTMSGVGVISGWSCLGGELMAEFRNAAGEVIGTSPLAHGISRVDTMDRCGDTLNGFSATVNWNIPTLGDATSIHLIQNGEEVASNNFSVLALGDEFIQGMWTTTVPDFPGAGQSATVEWDMSQQRFVVTEIN